MRDALFGPEATITLPQARIDRFKRVRGEKEDDGEETEDDGGQACEARTGGQACRARCRQQVKRRSFPSLDDCSPSAMPMLPPLSRHTPVWMPAPGTEALTVPSSAQSFQLKW